jgi:hypothetical protein
MALKHFLMMPIYHAFTENIIKKSSVENVESATLPIIQEPRAPSATFGTKKEQHTQSVRFKGHKLNGQCHQTRMTLKWGSFKSLSLIYYRHFNFLSWGSKSVQIFHFVLNLIWGCSNWVQIALFASWNYSGFSAFLGLAVWFLRIFYNFALFASWKLLELLYIL